MIEALIVVGLGWLVYSWLKREWRKTADQPQLPSNKGSAPKKRPSKSKSYPVAIVGESNYQPAIRKCKVGDYVDFYKELNNPHSKSGQPLAVTDLQGRTLGYVPEDSWLKRVVYDDNKGIVAKINMISKGDGRTYGVWLTVAVEGPPIGTREFTRD